MGTAPSAIGASGSAARARAVEFLVGQLTLGIQSHLAHLSQASFPAAGNSRRGLVGGDEDGRGRRRNRHRSDLSDAGRRPHGSESNPKAPGWYPTRTNPTDQNYWDGQDWTARRRWTAGKGWTVAGDAPQGGRHRASPPDPGRHRLSANPYAPAAAMAAPTRTKATGFTFSLGVLLLWICGIALMYGSVGSWVHVSGNVGIADFHVSINGTDPAVFHPDQRQRVGDLHRRHPHRHLRLLRDDVGRAGAGDLDRHRGRRDHGLRHLRHVPHRAEDRPGADVGSANVSVGWGLICVLSAAVLATLVTLLKLIQR